MVVLVDGSVHERSTRAVHDYVAATQARLHMEVERHGESAREMRSFKELERSITREELQRLWPHADIDAAFERARNQPLRLGV